jgi:hypothetical protein
MLYYSDKVRKVIGTFFRYRNDIDIYTEDELPDKEFYRVFFKRLIDNDNIIINDVIPLGSRTVVLDKYREYIKSKSARKSFFLIDGDLDLILKNNPSDSVNFYVHKVYCIENYLIDKKAILELTYYNHGVKSKDELSVELNLDKWIANVSIRFCRLFLSFAVLKQLGGGPKIENANYFLREKGHQAIIDETLITQYQLQIKNSAIDILKKTYANPEKEYNKIFKKLSEKWEDKKNVALQIVSGKDYLLPLLQFHLNTICKKASVIPRRNIKLFLVNYCDLSSLSELRNLLTS